MKFFLLAFVYIFVIPPPRVYAYLNPDSGSYMLQIIMGTALGIIVSIKVFWKNITSFFHKNTHSNENSNDNDKK